MLLPTAEADRPSARPAATEAQRLGCANEGDDAVQLLHASEIDAGLLMIALSGTNAGGAVSRGDAHALRVAGRALSDRPCDRKRRADLARPDRAADPGYAFVPAMLVVGIGTGMPWGLMDGLSVSVVPKERVGMATGIFSTTRVAGEGIALAVVIAVLATFAQTGLADRLAGMGLRAPAGMAEAAQLLATGDLGGAASMLPGTGAPLLRQAYGAAFGEVLHVLTGGDGDRLGAGGPHLPRRIAEGGLAHQGRGGQVRARAKLTAGPVSRRLQRLKAIANLGRQPCRFIRKHGP